MGPGTPRDVVSGVVVDPALRVPPPLDAELKVAVLPLDDEPPELPDGRVAK
jgi:hypothetical protein